MNGPGRRSFAFLDHLAYDLEGLAAGAGQQKSGEALVRGDKHKTGLP
jgi:hypothetical protein